MGTQEGVSGGRQQLPVKEVPDGQWPPSGIKQVPGPGGCTHASFGPHVMVPQVSAPASGGAASAGPLPPLPPAPASVQTIPAQAGAQVRVPLQATQHW